MYAAHPASLFYVQNKADRSQQRDVVTQPIQDGLIIANSNVDANPPEWLRNGSASEVGNEASVVIAER